LPAGATTCNDVDDTTLTPVPAVPPNDTDAPDTNPDPVTVTDVPPDDGPYPGLTPDTVGTGPGGGADPAQVTTTGADTATPGAVL
jgi:hypothetical protein